jgi:DNA-binding CsgD family transcriptional regulator
MDILTLPASSEVCLLDRLQYGVILYGDCHKKSIVSVNRHALNLLARNRSLTMRDNTVHCHDALERMRLAKLLTDLAAGTGGTLVVRGAGDAPIILLAIPLGPIKSGVSAVDSMAAATACCALVFGMHQASANLEIDAFGSLYHLTAAERRVLDQLFHNASPREIAHANGVSVRTVRSQLSTIYNKTGVTGQRELFALLREVPPFTLH